jgi:putative ABC transport system permease protein
LLSQKSLAVKIFGDAAKAINQSINFGPGYGNTITGVIKDIPENNHLRFSGVRSTDASFQYQ